MPFPRWRDTRLPTGVTPPAIGRRDPDEIRGIRQPAMLAYYRRLNTVEPELARCYSQHWPSVARQIVRPLDAPMAIELASHGGIRRGFRVDELLVARPVVIDQVWPAAAAAAAAAADEQSKANGKAAAAKKAGGNASRRGDRVAKTQRGREGFLGRGESEAEGEEDSEEEDDESEEEPRKPANRSHKRKKQPAAKAGEAVKGSGTTARSSAAACRQCTDPVRDPTTRTILQ